MLMRQNVNNDISNDAPIASSSGTFVQVGIVLCFGV